MRQNGHDIEQISKAARNDFAYCLYHRKNSFPKNVSKAIRNDNVGKYDITIFVRVYERENM